MKNIQHKLIILFFIALAFPVFAQGDSTFEFRYEIHKIYPPISITKEKLTEAKNLADLNFRYKSSWVKEYIKVEVLASHNGKIKKVLGENDILSQAQKDIMNTADVGTDISVNVQYIPDNSLKHNDPKEMNFTFTVEPENEAKYVMGQSELKQYIKKNAIDKISTSCFKQYNLTAVKFTVNEEGQIMNAHIFESSRDEAVDKLLLETICNMPSWKPAEYANGKKVEQEFVLTVGDMKSCIINLLNIRNDGVPPILGY